MGPGAVTRKRAPRRPNRGLPAGYQKVMLMEKETLAGVASQRGGRAEDNMVTTQDKGGPNMKIKIAFGVLAVAAMLVAGVFSRTASADYPPPNGSVEFGVANTTADPGTAVTVTLTVLDAAGNPVANATCTMSITDQPGSGASVTQNGAETDANGAITGTLDVGGSLGSVVVTVVCPVGPGSSEVLSASGTVVVMAGGGALPPGSLPSTPPANLPSTGMGLASSGGGTWFAQLAIALAAAGGVLLALGASKRTA